MYFPKYSVQVLVCIIVLASLYYGVFNHINDAPQSIHMWRQSDCLSMTMNYYQYHYSLLEPHINNLGIDGTGKTCSEFPLLYYCIAKIWQYTGIHMFIYRGLVLVMFCIGLAYITKTLEMLLPNSVIAISIAVLLFSSPTLVYYAHTVLCDIPAFSLSCIGFYYTISYLQSGKQKHLILLLMCYVMSGLLKISSQLISVSLFSICFIELAKSILKKEKLNPRYLSMCIGLTCVFSIQALWYVYARNYNLKFNAGMFLTGILPIWNLKYFEIIKISHAVYDHLTWSYFRGVTTIVIAIAFIYVIYNRKSVQQKFLYSVLLCVSTGLVLYMILFFEALKDHDYYCINLFISVPLILILFFLILKQHHVNLNSKYVLIALCIGLIHNIDFAKRRINQRYQFSNWQNTAYHTTFSKFEKLKDQLASYGISEESKIISISDDSINASLYFLNRKGWTNYNIQNRIDNLNACINKGAQYLIVLNIQHTQYSKLIASFAKQLVVKTPDFSIYKLT